MKAIRTIFQQFFAGNGTAASNSEVDSHSNSLHNHDKHTKSMQPLSFESRTFPSIRSVVSSEYSSSLTERLAQIQSTAWFYQDGKAAAHTDHMFQNDQVNNDTGDSSNSAAPSRKVVYPFLTSMHHIRPLQWYGGRMRSLSRGWVTSEAFWNYQHITKAMFDAEIAAGRNWNPFDYAQTWSVATFAILDADSRAFPFLIEYSGSFGDSNTHARAYIYTCKPAVDDSRQPGPDICIGRITSEYDCSKVTIDIGRLHEALPQFAATYRPHDMVDTVRSQCMLWGEEERFDTSIALMKRDEGNSPEFQYELPLLRQILRQSELAALAPSPSSSSTSFSSSSSSSSSSNDPQLLFFNIEYPVEGYESKAYSDWRHSLQQFYASLSPTEQLQNQLEVMIAAAGCYLFRLTPTHLFTENQPTELRHKLTMRALTKLTPAQAKKFTSAALPPTTTTSTDFLTTSLSAPSVSKWPHREIIWGKAAERPLPDELLRLIAEYTLDELELVDLPWIANSREEQIAAETIGADAGVFKQWTSDLRALRGSRQIYGTPPESGIEVSEGYDFDKYDK